MLHFMTTAFYHFCRFPVCLLLLVLYFLGRHDGQTVDKIDTNMMKDHALYDSQTTRFRSGLDLTLPHAEEKVRPQAARRTMPTSVG